MVNQKLLTALQEKGWSIETASVKIGVGRVTFSRWVNGHQEPQPALLELLCQVFGKSASDLGYGHLSKEPVSTEMEARNGQVFRADQNFYTFAGDQLATLTTLLKLGESIMFDPTK